MSSGAAPIPAIAPIAVYGRRRPQRDRVRSLNCPVSGATTRVATAPTPRIMPKLLVRPGAICSNRIANENDIGTIDAVAIPNVAIINMTRFHEETRCASGTDVAATIRDYL